MLGLIAAGWTSSSFCGSNCVLTAWKLELYMFNKTSSKIYSLILSGTFFPGNMLQTDLKSNIRLMRTLYYYFKSWKGSPCMQATDGNYWLGQVLVGLLNGYTIHPKKDDVLAVNLDKYLVQIHSYCPYSFFRFITKIFFLDGESTLLHVVGWVSVFLALYIMYICI
jgi:hypothetical protein